MQIIDLEHYRHPDTKMYVKKSEGLMVRKFIKLDKKDLDNEIYCIQIPFDTVAIGGSFFTGLFQKSILNLGINGFKAKYTFRSSVGDALSTELQRDISEGLWELVEMMKEACE